MRHFDFVSAQERDRLFLHAPEPFGADEDAATLGVALGATLYCPASRPNLAADIVRRAAHGVVSTVVCLEDSIPDDDLRAAERNVVDQLRSLAESTEQVPMVFVRVRSADQIALLVRELGADARMLAGFVLPKFGEDTGAEYLDAVVAAGEAAGRRLLAMPVLESAEIAYLESRASSLDGTRQLLEKYRDLVPAVRIGATDLSGAYGLRRPRDFTIWEIRVVADVISTIVNIFGRADAGAFVVAGPVWEYFTTTERMFKPQLRESLFVGPTERALRTKLVAADLDGLIREVALDRANGLTGKTVIHPSHVAAVHALSVVGHEEFADAGDILATNRSGGAAASSYGNKMNESKPHTAWARRTLLRARMFGVAREHVSFADLLGASLYQ